MHPFRPPAPVVSFLGVDNNARTQTGTVTVSGIDFAQSDNTLSARIDTNACATAAWASATSVMCRNTNGPTIHSVEVTVGLILGTRYPAFTFDGWSECLSNTCTFSCLNHSPNASPDRQRLAQPQPATLHGTERHHLGPELQLPGRQLGRHHADDPGCPRRVRHVVVALGHQPGVLPEHAGPARGSHDHPDRLGLRGDPDARLHL